MKARSTTPSLLALCSTTIWLCGGCDTPLKSVSRIEETRVLGARVETVGDPERASPRPGERASLRFFVVSPGGAPQVGYDLSVCAVSPTSSGFPSCSGTPFATAKQTNPSLAAPGLGFEIPSDIDLNATPHGFVGGQIGKAEVAFEFELESPEQSNANPEFSANSLTLDGQPWPASEAAATCQNGLDQVAPGSVHALSLSFTDGDFDPLPQTTALDPARETLLLSNFCDSGELDHAFSSLSPDGDESALVHWTAPAKVNGAGAIARLYFVIRDSRGGEDFTSRALCVVR